MNKHLHLGDSRISIYEGNILKFQKKIKNLTFLVATVTLLFFSFKASALTSLEQSKKIEFLASDPMLTIADDWIIDTTLNKVVFYHKLVLCGDKKAVLLKFDNQNGFNVNISWNETLGTKQLPGLIESTFGIKKLLIKPGIIAPTDCTDSQNSILVILPNSVNPTFIADILSFNFSNITITQ